MFQHYALSSDALTCAAPARVLLGKQTRRGGVAVVVKHVISTTSITLFIVNYTY